MKIEITQIQTANRLDWEYGEYSGTITFPYDDRAPAVIEYAGAPEEHWEKLEEEIERAACDKIMELSSKRL